MVLRSWRWATVVIGLVLVIAVACTGDESRASLPADEQAAVEEGMVSNEDMSNDPPAITADSLLPPVGDEPPPEQFPPTPPPGVEGVVATDVDTAPLPEWARDAVELRVEQRLVANGERLLTQLGCTNCDGATGAVGSWNAVDGLERTLFSGAQRGSEAVSTDGRQVGVLVCAPGCGQGVAVPQSLYWSEDAGWSWREFALPLGFWSSEGFDLEDRLVLRRIELDAESFTSTLVERVVHPDVAPLPLDEDFDRNRLSTARDADGERWSARDPGGPQLFPSHGLFRGDELVEDFEPYVVTALGLAGDGALAIGLHCGAFGAEGPVFSRCSRELIGAASLLIEGDGDAASYRIPAGLVELPQARDDEFPTLARLRWVGEEALWGQLVSFSPRLIRRPIFIDLEAGVAEVFVEDVPTPSDIVPLAFGAAPAQVAVTGLDGACMPLRSLPQESVEIESEACVLSGELTGESAVDAGGGEWVFLQADEVAGWTRVEDTGL